MEVNREEDRFQDYSTVNSSSSLPFLITALSTVLMNRPRHVRAQCHGTSNEFRFPLPARKAQGVDRPHYVIHYITWQHLSSLSYQVASS